MKRYAGLAIALLCASGCADFGELYPNHNVVLAPQPVAKRADGQSPLAIRYITAPGAAFITNTECGVVTVSYNPAVDAAVESTLAWYFTPVFDTAPPPAGPHFMVKSEMDEHRLQVHFVDPATLDTVWTFTHEYQPIWGPCVGMKNTEQSNLYDSLSALGTEIKERREWLLGYADRKARAADAETAADQALKDRDKARAFSLYVKELDGIPYGAKLFQRVLDKMLPLLPYGDPPPVSDEAKRAMTQGQTRFKESKDIFAVTHSIDDLERAVELAPWWPAAYFNLGIAYEGALSMNSGGAVVWVPKAIECYKRYLAAAPNAADVESVKKRVWALETRTP